MILHSALTGHASRTDWILHMPIEYNTASAWSRDSSTLFGDAVRVYVGQIVTTVVLSQPGPRMSWRPALPSLRTESGRLPHSASASLRPWRRGGTRSGRWPPTGRCRVR